MPATREWFAREGSQYPNAYASTPLCCPSRASIFTGRYAHNHGIQSNKVEPRDVPGSTWLSSYLHEGGYRTGLYGKVLNSWAYADSPPGFDEWATFPGGYYNRQWNINGSARQVEIYSTTFIEEQATDFLLRAEENDDQPWYLHLTPFAPHGPSTPEPIYRHVQLGRWDGNPAVRERNVKDKPPWLREQICDLRCGNKIRRRHFRSLMSVDDMVSAVRVQLEELGETDTLAIYTTDNGYLWGEHGRKFKGQPWTHPASVPFYMRWPGHVGEDRVVRDMALNVDIAPTALDAARLRAPTDPVMDGRSLLSSEPRDRVLLEHWCNDKGCDVWASTRTPTYQYIERYDESGVRIFREYYDLVEDPWQLRNVFKDRRSGNDPDDLRAIRRQLQADRLCVGSNCP